MANERAYDQLKNSLKIYKDAEQSMVSFWTDTDPLYTKEYQSYMDNKFYAKNKTASNKSAGWLEFKKRLFRDFLGMQLPIIWPIIYPTTIEIIDGKDMIKPPFAGTSVSTRKFLWTGAIPYYGTWYKWNLVQKHAPYLSPVIGLGGVLMEGVYTYSLYLSISNYREYNNVICNLALRMADVQTFIHTAQAMHATIASNPALESIYGQHLTAVRELLAEAKAGTELGQLINYLQSLPLCHWSYFFNNAGKLLAAHKLFIEHKEAFSDAIYELGLLDAYLSFTTLVKESQAYDPDHAYHFVDFLDRKQKSKPYINIKAMWNPFLDAKQAVDNSLEMDAASGVRNVILTGPNAGGKSTFLTGITNTLLLAHVVGIGPAQSITLTPFNRINTYIDIADDIAAGKSLFMAEVDRAQKHINLLKTLKEDEFSFTIFDEPFSGTNPKEGAAAEYSILEAIAAYTNTFNLVATHYPTVMLLEERAKGKGFANYKVYITRDKPGKKLNYTYKIVPGRSTQAIAIDILEEHGYDTAMLKRAREIIEHPERYQANF